MPMRRGICRRFDGPIAQMKHEPSRQLNPLRTMPNLLTIGRICLAPFLVSAVLEGKFVTGFVLFMAAGITDALDGMLARILKQRTILGQYLDPVADKLLLSTLFLVLTHMNLIPIRVTALVFGRDLGILVVAAILYSAAGRRDFKPSIFGKANTLAQVTAVASVLLYQIDHAAWVGLLKKWSLYATIALTIASGLHYAWLISRRTTTPMANSASGGGAAA
jgi:cardiolipin synthase (CMP-forming)